MALAEADKSHGKLRQQTAGLEAKLATIGEAGTLEQRIGELHKAVSGSMGPAPDT